IFKRIPSEISDDIEELKMGIKRELSLYIYDSFYEINSEITKNTYSCSRYEREGVVCPSQLRKGLFTTSAVAKIDHNTSSTTSQTSFHGTAISLVQHPTTNNQGTPRATDTFDPTASTTTKTIAHLPSSYTEIAPMTQPNGDLYAPRVPDQSLAPPAPPDSSLIDEENDWLTSTQQLISKDKLDPKDFVSWAAYKASWSALSHYQPAIITLLPMFLDNAHSMAMIAHSMRVIKVAVEHVSPSQLSSSNRSRSALVCLSQADTVENS
ncbi:Hypothetical predicted protein, partial [Paramuricea clavata]